MAFLRQLYFCLLRCGHAHLPRRLPSPFQGRHTCPQQRSQSPFCPTPFSGEARAHIFPNDCPPLFRGGTRAHNNSLLVALPFSIEARTPSTTIALPISGEAHVPTTTITVPFLPSPFFGGGTRDQCRRPAPPPEKLRASRRAMHLPLKGEGIWPYAPPPLKKGRAIIVEGLHSRPSPAEKGRAIVVEGLHASPEKREGKKEDQRRHPAPPLKRGGGRSPVQSLPSSPFQGGAQGGGVGPYCPPIFSRGPQ